MPASGGKRWRTPWYLWIQLIFWSALTTQAFPYVDSSPKAVLAVTGPLCILLAVFFLIKFYWERRKGLPSGTSKTQSGPQSVRQLYP